MSDPNLQTPTLLAVITARGGSKGLPRKNVLPLAGKPLIAWTIEAAKAARHVTRVIVSTDDEEIAECARSAGCDVPFVRPADLAGDRSKQADVMLHAVNWIRSNEGKGYDLVLCLQPTSPLRGAEHIDEAVDQFIASDAVSLISIKEQDYPPWWMFRLDGGRLKPAFDFEPGRNIFDMQRQEFPVVYRPNGAIYVTRTSSLLNTGRIVDLANCAYYQMPEECSLSIDTAVHFATIEALVRLRSGRPSAENEGARSE